MGNAENHKRILFLAQLPPPYHGQSVVAGAVHEIFAANPETQIKHLWSGGATNATDVGRRSLGKYLGFAKMTAKLIGLALSGKRFDVAYLGVAPWAHTLARDAILSGLAKLVAKRVWVHVHGEGLENIIHPQTLIQRIYRKIFMDTELLAITSATATLGKSSGVFRVVNHLPNFADDPGPIKKRQGNAIHLGSVGNLDPRKGVFEFLTCIGDLRNNGHRVRGTIIGGPTAELSVEALRDHVEKSGLSGCVNVTGRVSEQEKHKLLGEIDVFLYPSRHDLAPLALIEAMAHSCVPIVFETGGIPEIVGPGLEKNVVPLSVNQAEFSSNVSKIIKRYLDNRKSYDDASTTARTNFIARYSKNGFIRNVLALLAKDIGSKQDHANPTSTIVGENL